MNESQLPFLVEGIIILSTILLGLWLRSSGKPYGKLKPILHIIFFAWFTMGYGFIASTIWAVETSTTLKGLIVIMGLAILAQLISGIRLLRAKQVDQYLQKVHMIAASLIILSDVVAFFIAGA